MKAYPAFEYEEYIASPILGDMSNVSVKKLITFKNNTRFSIIAKEIIKIKPSELKKTLIENTEPDTYLSEEIIKYYKPEELYKILIEIKKINDTYYHLIIPEELNEEYSLVFGICIPIKEKK